MTSEIKPRINEKGRPVCNPDCRRWNSEDRFVGPYLCGMVRPNTPCIPALLQGWAKLEAVREWRGSNICEDSLMAKELRAILDGGEE